MFSAVTLGLTISGITISQTGIAHNSGTITPTIMGYLDDQGSYAVEHPTAANYKVAGGKVAWAGSSLGIATGLSSVIGFFASLNADKYSAVSAANVEWVNSITAGTVTAALVSVTGSVAQKITIVSGGTLTWMAFGT